MPVARIHSESLFDVYPDTHEANGIVHNFCSPDCMAEFALSLDPNFEIMQNNGEPAMIDEVCAECGVKLIESQEAQYLKWQDQVLEFAQEDEPNFVPDFDFIKTCYKWGSPAGGAADDCVRRFREKSCA